MQKINKLVAWLISYLVALVVLAAPAYASVLSIQQLPSYITKFMNVFQKNGFEAETTPRAEAFWQFTSSREARRWLDNKLFQYESSDLV